MESRYIVLVPISGIADKQELCMCLSPESAAEIVRALLAAWSDDGREVTVRLKMFAIHD